MRVDNTADSMLKETSDKEPKELGLGENSRLKIVQGNTCVILEPEVASFCWDVKNLGARVSPKELEALPFMPDMFENVTFILSQDGSRSVGIEVT